MNPQQPYYQPQQGPTPNYDFILNPAPPPKKPLIPSGNSLLSRLAIAAGGLIVLVIVIVVFVSILTGGKGNNAPLISVAQAQNELIRVATLGTQQATDQSAKNFAVNANLSLTSEQQSLLSYLKGRGTKVSTKELGLTKNTQTDTTLKNAQAASTFDSTFESIMQTQLTAYAQSLKTAFANAPGPNARKLLSDDYAAAGLLLKQLPPSTTSGS